MFEHVAIVVLFLEEYFKAAGKAEKVWDLVKDWMENQEKSARTEIMESDPIIQALNLICESAWKQLRYDTAHLDDGHDDAVRLRSQVIKLDVHTLLADVQFNESQVTIKGRAGELFSAFTLAFKAHSNRSFPYPSGKVLSQRITNVKKELEKNGYEVKEGRDTHNDQKIYEFIKVMRVSAGIDSPTPAAIPAEIIDEN